MVGGTAGVLFLVSVWGGVSCDRVCLLFFEGALEDKDITALRLVGIILVEKETVPELGRIAFVM